MRMIGDALDIVADKTHAAAVAESEQLRERIEHGTLLDGPEHVIHGGRQTGKTMLAKKWLTDAPAGVRRVLIVIDGYRADHIKQELGLRSRDDSVISYRRLLNEGIDPDAVYGIDETVEILSNLLGLRESPRLVTICTAAPWQGQPSA